MANPCPRCGGHLTESRGTVALPERLRFTQLNESRIENVPRPAVVVTCDRCDYANEKEER